VTLATVFTVCFGLFVAAGIVFFLARTRLALTLSLGSLLAAIAMQYAVEALVRRGLRRSLAIAAVIGALLALLAGLGLLLVPPIASQAKALAAEGPALWRKLQEAPWFVSLDARLHLKDQLRAAGPSAAGAVNPVLSAIGGVVTGIGAVLAFVFLAVFMVVFGPDLVAAGLELLPPRWRASWERVGWSVYRSVGGYLAGLLAICAINATLTTVFLAIARVQFFLPLGILSGSSSLVPYAGPLVTGATITLLALVTGGVWKALAVAVYFVVYGQLEGNVLAPIVYRRTAHVNPLMTLLAVLFFAEFLGVMGAVIAVPVAAAAQVVLKELVARREEARTEGP
jgi:predicted PurR-regulated permease PerM